MLNAFRKSKIAVSLFSLVVLTSCGSDNDVSSSDSIILSGTVATGAPCVGSNVKAFDGRGTLVGDTTANDGGDYEIRANPLFRGGPLVIQATCQSSDNPVLIAMADTTTSTTANVNTITTLVAALTSVVGDPTQLPIELASGKVTFNETTILANFARVQGILRPLLDALKTQIQDVRSGFAPANGTGVDRLLDALKVTITKNPNGTSTIEIAIKVAGDNVQPPVIRFENSTLLESILSSQGITATQVQGQTITESILVPPGTSAKITRLLARIKDCFALPTATRVNNPNGSASNIVAAACKSIFFNSDPTGYRHNGALVAANGALANLFSDSGTGTGFGQGEFLYQRDDGTIVPNVS